MCATDRQDVRGWPDARRAGAGARPGARHRDARAGQGDHRSQARSRHPAAHPTAHPAAHPGQAPRPAGGLGTAVDAGVTLAGGAPNRHRMLRLIQELIRGTSELISGPSALRPGEGRARRQAQHAPGPEARQAEPPVSPLRPLGERSFRPRYFISAQRPSSASRPTVRPGGRDATPRTASSTPGMNEERSSESCRMVRVSPCPPRSTSW
jgi:hypothetical protein